MKWINPNFIGIANYIVWLSIYGFIICRIMEIPLNDAILRGGFIVILFSFLVLKFLPDPLKDFAGYSLTLSSANMVHKNITAPFLLTCSVFLIGITILSRPHLSVTIGIISLSTIFLLLGLLLYNLKFIKFTKDQIFVLGNQLKTYEIGDVDEVKFLWILALISIRKRKHFTLIYLHSGLNNLDNFSLLGSIVSRRKLELD